ncbi:MAG: nucleoside hydrolase [Bacteroidales bacterium]|nr:nucleoside hydrolase [Bacteroidales bacterium]
MKKFLPLVFAVMILFSEGKAHPWKPDHYVVIDTDCGLDDFRTLRMMLESDNIRILAITTSHGVLRADEGYDKVKDLLQTTFHKGIMVGLNQGGNWKDSGCEAARKFWWGQHEAPQTKEQKDYTEVLNRVFQHHQGKITFINLGSLTTVVNYFSEYPEQQSKIKEVLWTSNYNHPARDFNHMLDPEAYSSLQRLELPVTILHQEILDTYPGEWLEQLKNTETRSSRHILSSLEIPGSSFARNLYDEITFLYLLRPDLFSQEIQDNILHLELNSPAESLKPVMDSIFSGTKVNTQAFLDFPTAPGDYLEDIQQIMPETIRQWGEDEWATCVLTCEIHRHVGVYTLIGAKMGVRAREYFGAGMDELHIVSHAGLEPPFSCLNDGLQVSTGATLGHGLISVKEETKDPRAEFCYLGQKITITLKEEYKTEVASKIKELSYIYGLDSNIYWDRVRDLALSIWREWDRHKIFQIEK